MPYDPTNRELDIKLKIGGQGSVVLKTYIYSKLYTLLLDITTSNVPYGIQYSARDGSILLILHAGSIPLSMRDLRLNTFVADSE